MTTNTKEYAISVEEAARRLGVGRNLAYEMARTGKLPVLRFGTRRLLVPVEALQEMLRERSSQPSKARRNGSP